MTPALQALVLELSRLAQIRISSLIRGSGHHGMGRAVDIGNEEIAAASRTATGGITTSGRSTTTTARR